MPTNNPNTRQVGGEHYLKNTVPCEHCGGALEHWSVYQFFPYLIGTITKYLWRYQNKGGVQDLEKARHYLDKLIAGEKNIHARVGRKR